MAERRMFAKTIIDSDAFLEMPLSSQTLYFHLSMRADDEGFINNPNSIMRVVGAKYDDMKLLIAKKFIIPFESGVVVIKHWKIHNYIQNDRFTSTKYPDEKAMLSFGVNKEYKLENNPCIQNGYTMDTQVRLGKVSIGKVSKALVENKTLDITSVEEIVSYLNKICERSYRSSTGKTKKLIKSRINEGFTIDDFKKVIDIKNEQWGDDNKMKEYLRPETLFGTKFESYLQQPKPTNKHDVPDYMTDNKKKPDQSEEKRKELLDKLRRKENE